MAEHWQAHVHKNYNDTILRLKMTSSIGCIPRPRSKSSFLFASVWDFPLQGGVVLGGWLSPSVETKVYSQGGMWLAEQTKQARFTLQMFVKQLCLLVCSGCRQLISEKWSCGKHNALYLLFKDRLLQLSSEGEAFGQVVGEHHCFKSRLILFLCSL